MSDCIAALEEAYGELAFAELIRKETIKWGDVVKRAGIKID